jgi:hypothetical protein
MQVNIIQPGKELGLFTEDLQGGMLVLIKT